MACVGRLATRVDVSVFKSTTGGIRSTRRQIKCTAVGRTKSLGGTPPEMMRFGCPSSQVILRNTGLRTSHRNPNWGWAGTTTPHQHQHLPPLQALIAPTETLPLYTALLLCASLGAYADKTKVGKALSGPVSAMLFGALLANTNILPPSGPHYSVIQTTTVSLATPCLLFGADLRTVLRVTGKLSLAFLAGSLAVALASFFAFYALSNPMHVVGSSSNGDGWKIAAALVAKNIGGGINYVAVCNTLGVTPAAFAAGIAADNIFAVLYFPLTSFLGGEPESLKGDLKGNGSSFDRSDRDTIDTIIPTPTPPRTSNKNDWNTVDEYDNWHDEEQTIEAVTQNNPNPEISIGKLLVAVTVSCAVLSVADRVAPESLGVLPTATAITVLLATAAPQSVSKYLKPAGDVIGSSLLFFFFATAGAAGGPITSAFTFPVLFTYLAILYFVHLCGIFAVGKKVLGLSTKEILVASNANVGGPATAGALATGKNWHALIVPGMLVGNLGNAIGTFIGLGMAKVFYHVCW